MRQTSTSHLTRSFFAVKVSFFSELRLLVRRSSESPVERLLLAVDSSFSRQGLVSLSLSDRSGRGEGSQARTGHPPCGTGQAPQVLRRLVARTTAQQLGVEDFTAPIQFAITTRSGTECQKDTELTLTSLDGVSAFDLIPRRAMVEGLARLSGCFFIFFTVGLPHICGRTKDCPSDPPRRRWGTGRPTCALLVRSWPTCRVGCNAGEDGVRKGCLPSRMTSAFCPHPRELFQSMPQWCRSWAGLRRVAARCRSC